jgi:hypothetical protein
MENDAPVVGPDAPTANSRMVKLDRSANFRFAHYRPMLRFMGWSL